MIISSFPTSASADDQTITAVKKVNFTLFASAWSGDSAPYTQTVDVDALMIEDQNGYISLSQDATEEQRDAERRANLYVTNQSATTITVIADGEKPTVDLPCVLSLFVTEGGDFAGDFAQRWELGEHEDDTGNPHKVTAEQINAVPMPTGGTVGQVLTKVSGGVAWSTVQSGDTTLAAASKSYPFILAASAWSGDSAPYTQTVDLGVTVSSGQNGLIGISPSATETQRAVYRAAVLSVTAQGGTGVTITADGEKPAVDIPAEVILFAGEADFYTKEETDGLLDGLSGLYAPAGYGLGETYSRLLKSTDNLGDVRKSGWYYWNFASVPSDIPSGVTNGLMRVDASGWYNSCIQTVYHVSQALHAQKRQLGRDNAKSTDWEWVNPPMILGAEYRTTERYMGKPVYQYLAQIGSVGSGAVNIVLKLDGTDGSQNLNIKSPVSLSFVGNATASKPAAIFQMKNVDESYLYPDGIHLKTLGSFGFSDVAYAIIKYTKTTD